MRVFAIKNENNRIVSYLFYYERKKKFYIELLRNINEWETPLLLSSFTKRKIYTVDDYWSKKWVEQRIVPTDRQNIAHILRDNKLKEYDEFELLMLNKGRCPQDNLYLEEVEFTNLPADIKNRFNHRIEDVISLGDRSLLVFFKNNEAKICDLNKIVKRNSKLNTFFELYPEIFKEVCIQVGGYGIHWDENITITCDELYKSGISINLCLSDINSYINRRVINTSEACDILDCTRQNIEYLISQGKLRPIKVNEKSKMFRRIDVESLNWV